MNSSFGGAGSVLLVRMPVGHTLVVRVPFRILFQGPVAEYPSDMSKSLVPWAQPFA